jgi:hypothetical protein
MRRAGLLGLAAALLGLAAASCGTSGPDASAPASFDHFIAAGACEGEYWPTADWRTCRPEDVGMDSAALYTAYEFAAGSAFVTEGIAVVRRGYVVGEEYFRGYGPTTRFASYSVAKSFLSAVVGVAIDEGHVPSVDQPAYPYFDAWRAPGTDDRKRAITVRHLLTMSSGLRFTDATSGGIAGTDIEGIVNAADAVAYVLDLPSVAEPGHDRRLGHRGHGPRLRPLRLPLPDGRTVGRAGARPRGVGAPVGDGRPPVRRPVRLPVVAGAVLLPHPRQHSGLIASEPRGRGLRRWRAVSTSLHSHGVEPSRLLRAVRYWAMVEEVVVDCAFCGEPFALDVDTTGGEEQSYFEDCPVCCRPMEIFVRSRPGEILSISVSAD